MGCHQSSPSIEKDITLDRGMSFIAEVRYIKKKSPPSLPHEDKVIIDYLLPSLGNISFLESEEMEGLFYLLKKYALLDQSYEKILSLFEGKFYTFFKRKEFSLLGKEAFLLISRVDRPHKSHSSIRFFISENEKIERFLLIFGKVYHQIKYLSLGEDFDKNRRNFKKNYLDGLKEKLDKNLNLTLRI